MASASHRMRVEVIKQQIKIPEVALYMSEEEALILAGILRLVGGDPEDSLRGKVDGILNVLDHTLTKHVDTEWTDDPTAMKVSDLNANPIVQAVVVQARNGASSSGSGIHLSEKPLTF